MIKDRNVDPGASIGIDKLAFPYIVSGKYTDGSLPKILWVAKGGADSDSSAQGSRGEPFLTASGVRGAFTNTVDGRGDRVILGPGLWRETWNFGSGTGTTGAAGRMNKRDIGIYGSGGAHSGRTQVVGDGTSLTSTIRVQDGYLRGFILADMELDSVDSSNAGRIYPCLELITRDTGTLLATSDDYHARVTNVHVNSDGTPRAGFLLRGTTKAVFERCSTAGVILGIAFDASAENNPDNCRFFDPIFHDNVTADVATVRNDGEAVYSLVVGATALTNIYFFRPMFMDRGGTPVTNYVNLVGAMSNVGFYDFFAARDVADGTLMELPVAVIAIGASAAAAEFIIGA